MSEKLPTQIFDYPSTGEIVMTVIITAFVILGYGKLVGWF